MAEIRKIKIESYQDEDNRIRHRTKKKRFDLTSIIFVLGICIFMYPVLMHVIKNQMLKAEINTVSYELAQKHEDLAYLEAVEKYNSSIKGGAFQAGNKIQSSLDVYLNEDEPIATLLIPKINQDLPVYYKVTDKHLRKGLGVIENTSMPFGGIGTHSVITGHRGVSDADIFLKLDLIEEGDHLYINRGDKYLAYKAFNTEVVKPDETNYTQLDPDRDLITLVTCTPKLINSHRLLVFFERDLEEEAIFNQSHNAADGNIEEIALYSLTDEKMPTREDFFKDNPEDSAFDYFLYQLNTKWKSFTSWLKQQNLYMLITPIVCLIATVLYFKPKKKERKLAPQVPTISGNI